MKRFIVFLLFSVCVFSAFAEYQVFSYRAVIKRVDPKLTRQSGAYVETTSMTTDIIKGYLVTVCCYPCNASFGKSYPSWLYVLRSKDREKYLWQIPVQVDGGIFDSDFSIQVMESFFDNGIYDDCLTFRSYAKRAGKSWFRMELETTKEYDWSLHRGYAYLYYKAGFLGGKATSVSLSHVGFGSASWKMNPELAPYKDFNPYIVSASGPIVGTMACHDFSFDPSNYMTYSYAPVMGTFTVRYHNRLTNKIRGIPDWSIIDSIIYKELRFNSIQKEDDNTSLQYIENFY